MKQEKGILDFFLIESADLVNVLEQGFLALESNPDDLSKVEDLFRAAHSMKGSAALVRLHPISELAHKMEDLLEEVKDRRRPVSKPLIDWFLKALDVIKSLLKKASEGKPLPEEPVRVLQEEIQALHIVRPVKTTAVVERKEYDRGREEGELLSNMLRVRIDIIDEIMNKIGDLTVIKSHLLGRKKVIEELRGEVAFALSRLLKEVGDFTDRYAFSLPEKVSYVDPLLTEFRELEFDRYDELNLFTRKLQEITNDINEGLKSIEEFLAEITTHFSNIDRSLKEIRELLSEARTVEVGRLFQRFVRTVRDLASVEGKKVRLLVKGTETRIDKVPYERLYEPLLHLIRNAITHGIEPPQERRRKGKPEEGTIVLYCKRKGNTIEIYIKDDGRGIDLEKVREMAVKMGIFSSGQKITKKQLLRCIFHPGFSTMQKAALEAGRGIGLDVVREALAEINGTVEVATKKDQGTVFRLRFPVTLVVVNVVRFEVGGMEFVVPSSLVEELSELDVSRQPVQTSYRGLTARIRYLDRVFGMYTSAQSPRRPAIVVKDGSDMPVLLVVDSLLGQEDTLIKPLPRFIEGIGYYTGVSVSTEGKVRLVINPLTVVERPEHTTHSRFIPVALKQREKAILVVDDSLSVRKALTETLQMNQTRVITATNGLEALNIIDENWVDMVITDLEMPVMHGYELLREMNRRGLLGKLPVIIITSRGSDKHRDKALSFGIQEYIVKPFDHEELRQKVRSLLNLTT